MLRVALLHIDDVVLQDNKYYLLLFPEYIKQNSSPIKHRLDVLNQTWWILY